MREGSWLFRPTPKPPPKAVGFKPKELRNLCFVAWMYREGKVKS